MKSNGFLTFVLWLLSGFLILILQAIIGPFSIDMLLLTTMACTPAIWIGRNNDILQDFMRSLSERGEPSNIIEDEEDFGGIWIGN